MSIHYKVVKQSFGFDKARTKKYLVKAVSGHVIDLQDLCKQTTSVCGVYHVMVKIVIEGLMDVMVNNLDMGYSIKLEEFGIFRPGIRSKAQDTQETANINAIYRRKVNFVSGKMLKPFVKDTSFVRNDG